MTVNQQQQIVCPHCAAINRVPQQRLQDEPQCGKCHKALFSGAVLALSDAIFNKVLSGSSQPLLVLFWAPWCGYCQKTLPGFQQTSRRLEPDFRLATVNTERNKLTAARFAVNSLPTLVLFKYGKEIARQSGALSAPQIERWARSNAP